MSLIYRLLASSTGSRTSAIWAFVLCGFAVTAVPAQAADMGIPARSYYPPPPPPAIYDWTGIYAGGHIGGGQIGANYEFAPWVIGVEAAWTDSAITGSTKIGCSGPCLFGTAPTPIASERFTSHALWFADVAGRLGYAANDWLFYAKAGGAWMRVSYTEDLLTQAAGATAVTQVVTDNRTGFLVGAGIELGLVENLSAKIEYDFYDFGSKNYSFTSITPVGVKSDLHTLTVGLNYKFNWSGGPKP